MGLFDHPITLISRDGERSETVQATVDTGSAYTWIPRPLLRDLGILAVVTQRFELSDGRQVLMDMGELRVELLGDQRTTLVVFGPPETHPLLGAYTLEGFSLGVDPVNQRLIPVVARAGGPRVM